MRGLLAITLLTLLAVMGWGAGPTFAQGKPSPLQILRVTPQGEDVPAGNQIVVQFNRAVVPLGRMERTAEELGVSVTPSLTCQWRWINTTTLACQLDEKDRMKPSTAYKVTLAADKIVAEDGGALAAPYSHQFITERADVSYFDFHTWKGPAHPVIRVSFNQPVTKDSAQEHLFFQENDQPRQKVQVSPAPYDTQSFATGEVEARRTWLVEPRASLTGGAQGVRLSMAPGLVSLEGPAPSLAARDIVTFKTYPDFKFTGVQCTNNNDQEVFIAVNKSQTPAQLCNPLKPVGLQFSVPVLRSEVSANVAVSPDLAGGRKGYNPWGDENRDVSRLEQPYEGKPYTTWLPAGLKAAQEYTITVPRSKPGIKAALSQLMGKNTKEGMQDEFGRTLMKPVTIKFSTSHRPPNFVLPYKEAVLEKDVDSEVPLYVNNLEAYNLTYTRLNTLGVQTDQTYGQRVPSPQDVQFAVPLGVREMLGDKPGVVFGTLTTEPSTQRPGQEPTRLFAQITPYQVHFKLGHFQSLAWVTELASGKPVEGATVTLYADELSSLGEPEDAFAGALTDKDGLAVLPGTAAVDPLQEYLYAWREEDKRLFVRVDLNEDMALLPLSYDFFIDTWRASNETIWGDNRKKYGHLQAWGMTAQGVYRAGDTMQYKIFVRGQDNVSLTLPAEALSYTLEIFDPTEKSVLKKEGLKLSAFGALDGEYTLPKSATVGWYRFELTVHTDLADSSVYTLSPLRVLVSDFTVAPFRVSAEMYGNAFKAGDVIRLHADARMHAGGAYTDSDVRVTGIIKSRPYESKHPLAQGFVFDSFQEGSDSTQVFEKTAPLDDKGDWESDFTLPATDIVYGVLELEAAVQDDRGKTIAGTARADYRGVDRMVGMRSPQWTYEAKKPAAIPVLVLDEKDTPVAGTKINVTVEQEYINSARVKGAGNAYLSDITTEWRSVAHCELTSATEAQDCIFTPEVAGAYRLIAEIVDTRKVAHKTTLYIWVTGDDYVEWGNETDSQLVIIPEKATYQIGDTARYMIKNPFPGAHALVSIERYGVMDSFVTKLEGSTPVIEFPVKPDYMPGYYLSVIVQSPRVEAPPAEEGQVDLGKPTFRMGYVSVPVKDPVKEMEIKIDVAQAEYRPREKVKIALEAVPRLATAAPEPIEYTIAVLDEAVFDLIQGGRKAFDPYQGFYNLENLDLRNYSLMRRLVGRQKFEKKGANPGGDGGLDADMRTLFKYVSYWNPGLKADAQGHASIEFDAPDNLTGWRVLVLATTPHDRMGLGEGNFKVNRPTELRPVMPNQVREGDDFSAGFSVMNRTDKARTIRVTLEAEGNLAEGVAAEKTEEVTLEPYKRATVYMDVKAAHLPVSPEMPQGSIRFKASAADAEDSDATSYELPVNKSRQTDVAAQYGDITNVPVEQSIAVPDNIYVDSSQLDVVLSPSVLGNLGGAFRYMRDYPYTCWEQSLTRAVMAAQFKGLASYLPEDVVWKDSDKIPQEMLSRAIDFQAPNGGMAYFKPQDAYVDPYLSAYTALAFGWLRTAGYEVPQNVADKLHDYLKNFLKKDVQPDFYQPGMSATVRAVALAALVEAGQAGRDDVLRYAPHVKNMSLFGKALFMKAATKVGGMEKEIDSTAAAILATGNESAGKMSFAEELDSGYSRILATALRDNCAVLDAFMDYSRSEKGAALIGEAPAKIARYITQSRGNRDHWENTQENMFCMKALLGYSQNYESEKVAATIVAQFNQRPLGKVAFASVREESQSLTAALTEEDVGKKSLLQLVKEGTGRIYYAARLRYADRAAALGSLNAGMDMQRVYSVKRGDSWVAVTKNAEIKRGDLIRVDLYLKIPAARNFVVVNDPLPGGLETVNRDLATASTQDAETGEDISAQGWQGFDAGRWSFYHRELRHDSVRFYADWLDAGNYHLSYVAQAIADGAFNAPPAKAEEMYDADIYGRSSAAGFTIKTGTP